jgi:hypothetical protein
MTYNELVEDTGWEVPVLEAENEGHRMYFGPQAFAALVQAAGGSITVRPEDIPSTNAILVADTDDNGHYRVRVKN